MARFKIINSTGENWTAFSKGFTEHKLSLYLYTKKRSYGISLIWARDPFNRVCMTPFKTRMNVDKIKWRLGYLQFYMSRAR